jgi:hypothetical protein
MVPTDWIMPARGLCLQEPIPINASAISLKITWIKNSQPKKKKTHHIFRLTPTYVAPELIINILKIIL